MAGVHLQDVFSKQEGESARARARHCHGGGRVAHQALPCTLAIMVWFLASERSVSCASSTSAFVGLVLTVRVGACRVRTTSRHGVHGDCLLYISAYELRCLREVLQQ